MGLYQDLGIGNAGSADAVRDLLTSERNQWAEKAASSPAAEDAEKAERTVQNIDHLLHVLDGVKEAVPDVTLPLETAACALDHEIEEYADLEDSVLWVCTQRMFRSDYRKILAFLESVHEEELADDWRAFARSVRNAPAEEQKGGNKRKKFSRKRGGSEERGTAAVEPENQDRRDERGRKRDPGHEDLLSPDSDSRRSLSEVILVVAIVVMAILIIGGLFLLWHAKRAARETEEAAQAALSASSSSGLISTASGNAGENAQEETAKAGTSENAGETDTGDTSLPAQTGSEGDTSEEGPENAGEVSSGDGSGTSEDAPAGTEEDIPALLGRMSDYTILSDETVFPVLKEVSCSGSSATSVLTGDSGRVYGTDYLFDNDMSTSWQEGESDEGVGQSLTFTFDERTELRAIAVWGGSESSRSSYRNSNRPSDLTVTITCDGVSNEQAMTLDDIDGEQMIVFDDPVPTDTLTITIDGVYKGRQFNDTAISEMKFYTE